MLSESLRSIRLAKGLTQKAMAKMVGVQDEQYRSWEVGRHEPRGESLAKLSEALGVGAVELMVMRLERDAVVTWLVKQLSEGERVMVIGMMEDLVRRRGGMVTAPAVVAGPGAVVRPLADQVVSVTVGAAIVQPALPERGFEGCVEAAGAVAPATVESVEATMEAMGKEGV